MPETLKSLVQLDLSVFTSEVEIIAEFAAGENKDLVDFTTAKEYNGSAGNVTGTRKKVFRAVPF